MTQNKIFELMHFSFAGNIERISYDGVYVAYDGENAVIGAKDESTFARGCFLLASEIQKGKTAFEIKQKPSFETCGVKVGCQAVLGRQGTSTTPWLTERHG